ncbi:MAG: hypothetical protein JST30_07445 [Armatimonadetes bacterium]|nr:hypothetical protein [Armatimonadota bacterium]
MLVTHYSSRATLRIGWEFTCDHCGSLYWYGDTYQVTGRDSSAIVPSKTAARHAFYQMKHLLACAIERRSEAIKCPECGRISDAAIRNLRRRYVHSYSFPGYVAGIVGLCVALGNRPGVPGVSSENFFWIGVVGLAAGLVWISLVSFLSQSPGVVEHRLRRLLRQGLNTKEAIKEPVDLWAVSIDGVAMALLAEKAEPLPPKTAIDLLLGEEPR